MNIHDTNHSRRFDLEPPLLSQVLNNEFVTKFHDNLINFYDDCSEFTKQEKHTLVDYENKLKFFIDSTGVIKRMCSLYPEFAKNSISNNYFHVKVIASHLNLEMTQMTMEEKKPYIAIVSKLLDISFYLNRLNK